MTICRGDPGGGVKRRAAATQASPAKSKLVKLAKACFPGGLDVLVLGAALRAEHPAMRAIHGFVDHRRGCLSLGVARRRGARGLAGAWFPVAWGAVCLVRGVWVALGCGGVALNCCQWAAILASRSTS